MKKVLLLSCLILLCSFQAWSLRCKVCNYRIFAFMCLSSGVPCVADHGQKCKKEFIKEVKKMLYIKKGCTSPGDHCESTRGDNTYSKMIVCCDGKDFCNQ